MPPPVSSCGDYLFILGMWKSPTKLTLQHSHEQIVTFNMEENGTVEAVLSFVYACLLWQQLHVLSQKPWMIGGDFTIAFMQTISWEENFLRYVPWTISMKPYL